jgi:copper chaperone NosL
VIALLLLSACGPGLHEPADLAYDHLSCDQCGMMVGDPRFAAQLTTEDGDRLVFDDPACAFRHTAEGERVAHIWFHDANPAGGWLEAREAAFVEAAGAPMDGGLAAVPLGTPGAMSFAAASNRVLGGAR